MGCALTNWKCRPTFALRLIVIHFHSILGQYLHRTISYTPNSSVCAYVSLLHILVLSGMSLLSPALFMIELIQFRVGLWDIVILSNQVFPVSSSRNKSKVSKHNPNLYANKFDTKAGDRDACFIYICIYIYIYIYIYICIYIYIYIYIYCQCWYSNTSTASCETTKNCVWVFVCHVRLT